MVSQTRRLRPLWVEASSLVVHGRLDTIAVVQRDAGTRELGAGMDTAHLTTIVHLGPKSWEVSCLCGWRFIAQLRREAIAEGEHHWISSPLVTEVQWSVS